MIQAIIELLRREDLSHHLRNFLVAAGTRRSTPRQRTYINGKQTLGGKTVAVRVPTIETGITMAQKAATIPILPQGPRPIYWPYTGTAARSSMVSDAHRLSGPPKGEPSSGQAPHEQSIDSIHRTPSITAPCKADVPFSAGSWQSRTNLRSPQAHEFAFQTDRGDRLAAVGGCRNPQSHAAPPAVASGPVTASGRTRQNFHRYVQYTVLR